jgi:hypothetical protein
LIRTARSVGSIFPVADDTCPASTARIAVSSWIARVADCSFQARTVAGVVRDRIDTASNREPAVGSRTIQSSCFIGESSLVNVADRNRKPGDPDRADAVTGRQGGVPICPDAERNDIGGVGWWMA